MVVHARVLLAVKHVRHAAMDVRHINYCTLHAALYKLKDVIALLSVFDLSKKQWGSSTESAEGEEFGEGCPPPPLPHRGGWEGAVPLCQENF